MSLGGLPITVRVKVEQLAGFGERLGRLTEILVI